MKLTLIVKATEHCNANCMYCSVGDKETKKNRMDDEVLRLLFARIKTYLKKKPDDDVTITWHGGEPLLMGADFYRTAHRLQGDMLGNDAYRVEHAFQTNLTLFTEEFAEVFRILGVTSVGSSFECHEGLRRLSLRDHGEAYDAQFFQALARLEKTGTSVGFISVVTSPMLDKPIESLTYVANLFPDRINTGVQFNKLYLEGEAAKSDLHYLAVSAADFGHFLGKAFSYWIKRKNILPSVQPFATLENHLVKGHASLSCVDSGSCGATHLGIGPPGDIYQCGRSMDRRILCYGNLKENDFEDVFNHPDKKRLNQRSRQLAATECSGCRFFPHCNGGCPVEAHRDSGNFMHRAPVCDTKRVFFEQYFEPLTGINVSKPPEC